MLNLNQIKTNPVDGLHWNSWYNPAVFIIPTNMGMKPCLLHPPTPYGGIRMSVLIAPGAPERMGSIASLSIEDIKDRWNCLVPPADRREWDEQFIPF